VTLQAECLSGHRHHHHGPIVINIADASYAAAQDSGAWVPSADPRVASVLQGSTPVPDLCQGGAMEIGDDATFSATGGSQ
jgi:hypothetical protein